MASWTFTPVDLAADAQQAAWIDVLARLRLPVADFASADAATGSVAVATGPLGTEFALMHASPQTFSGRNANPGSSAWTVAILDGRGTLTSPAGTSSLGAGTLVVGAPEIDTTLRLEAPSRLMFVRFPKLAVSPRLVAPIERTVRALAEERGLARLFADYLAVLADRLGELDEADLPAVEQATIELFVAVLASSGGVAARGGAAGARATHLRRLCQRIEARLADPELSLVAVAAEDGISPRYLQKLFTAAGLKFSGYVRERRLERCYADLVSPIHAQLSVSEIGYRWGFGDAPHFSRAFRARYGLPPSQHRLRGLSGEAG